MAIELGYWLSSEEHPPNALVEHAVLAEEAGFTSAMISDHFHPWVPEQGQSPFVWSVLGAIANATTRLHIGTGVSAPIRRVHPAVLAHASATVAAMMPGRFFLGLGSGERLNEQVVGRRWPRAGERRKIVEEAIEVIRRLWSGEAVNHDGPHFRVEAAQLFTVPEVPPAIVVAASGRKSAELAGRVADGMVAVEADPRTVEAFEAAGGAGKPRLGKVQVCYAETEADARRIAHRSWAIAPIRGGALTELARPADFASLAAGATEDQVADAIVCGPDPERHLDAIRRFVAAGFTRVYVHQVGPQQHAFIDFYRREVAPKL